MPSDADIERAWSIYPKTLVDMAGVSGDSGATDSPRRWNRLVDRLQEQILVLQGSPIGRDAISELLDDPRPTVRLWSATHALLWNEARARTVLEALRDSPELVGLHATSARYTLREYDVGRLDREWGATGR